MSPPAVAHNDVPWTGCSYAWLLNAGGNIQVRVDPNAPFPPNGTGDGVLNSFTNRITFGVSQLNAGLLAAGQVGGAGMAAAGISEHARIAYRAVPTSFGQTTIRRRNNNAKLCTAPQHVVQGFQNGLTIVEINLRNDWFTQENDRRALWEACTPTSTTYTCSKWFDFGSTLTHELMHGLTLRHPEDVDAHTGQANNGPEANQARCSSTATWAGQDDATSCPSTGDSANSESRYRSARRSLGGYDNQSIDVQYVAN